MPNSKLYTLFEKIHREGWALTYDDVRLRSRYSEIVPDDVTNLRTRFTRRTWLNIPIVASAMDTVTGANMAIAMAENGGVGSIHRGVGMDPVAQAKAVGRVINRLHGRIETPITVPHDWSVERLLKRQEEKNYPFDTYPVMKGARMIGIVTGSNVRFCTDHSKTVAEIMTPRSKLVTAGPGISAMEAFKLLDKKKKTALPLFDGRGRLVGMYHFTDLMRLISNASSQHALDQQGHLLVCAAVGVGKAALKRAALLAKRGCAVFHIDTAHGNSRGVVETVKRLKRLYPHIDVAAGNVSTGDGALRLANAGADCVMVGQGPGSICTTRVIAGIGMPQVSAVWECSYALWKNGHFDVPICADGGIRNSGDIVIALALGASTVMIGNLLAGTEESAGETRLYGGRKVKDYRGMGSLAAMQASASSRERYGQLKEAPHKVVPEGIEGIVDYRGTVAEVLHQIVGGIKSGFAYNGVRTLGELWDKAEIVRITNAGLNESHPHDITITAQSPNYTGR